MGLHVVGEARARARPTDGSAFQAGLDLESVGDVTIIRAGSALPLDLPGAILSTPRGAVLLLTLVEGESSFKAADGRMKALRPGRALVIDGALPWKLRAEAGARLAGLSLPAHLVIPRFFSAEHLRAGSHRTHGVGMASLLCDLMQNLSSREATPFRSGALIDAVGGLVSAMLEDSLGADRPERGRIGRTRMDQISRHLRRHFANPALSATAVATSVGVSRRYLHKLYAQEGRSFHDELVELRVEACTRAFLDLGQAGKTIAQIAYGAGYADISQFNRHFRRLKGVTPSAMRRAALRAAAELGEQAPRRRWIDGASRTDGGRASPTLVWRRDDDDTASRSDAALEASSWTDWSD